MAMQINISELQKLQQNLQQLSDTEVFMNELVKELTSRLLAKVIKRTPVDSGLLRRGWTATTEEEAQGSSTNVKNYVNNLQIQKTGSTYTVYITNPVHYAPYVEFGHRTTNGGFVDGVFMLKISEEELAQDAPRIIENKLKKYLGGAFK